MMFLFAMSGLGERTGSWFIFLFTKLRINLWIKFINMNIGSTINLDINNYSLAELEKLLKLSANYTNENIVKQKE